MSTPSLKALARTVFLENTAANAHKRAHDVARKELFVGMTEAGVADFGLEVVDAEGKRVKLEAKIDAAEITVMDVRKLHGMVDEELFLQIVSATKAAIERLAGKDIAVLCEAKTPGTPNVAVKPVK